MRKEPTVPSFDKNEKEILNFWQEKDIFQKMKDKNIKEGKGKYFAFLDGPITANNPMGLHHPWARALKDTMIKYNALKGFDLHYQNGFDSQGLPVEVAVEKSLGINGKKEINEYGMAKFVEACMQRVRDMSAKQTEQSIRLGQFMDWEDSYYTNSDLNITSIWYFLKTCFEKGWLVKKFRPMPWCYRCGTTLSDHELADADGYKDVECNAVFFKLPLKGENSEILVWTTTPWTIAANVAIAVNPDIDYAVCKVKSQDRKIIVGNDAIKVLKDDLVKVEKVINGSELVGKEYEPTFPELKQQKFIHKLVAWEDVGATEGAGTVHIAPGCGAEDFELGQRYGLPNVCPVDEAGEYFSDFGFLAGKKTGEVEKDVFERLKKDGKLYYTHRYKHRYPFCWRCKEPLIFRLIEEWYIEMDEIRPLLIKAIENVEFQPDFMRKRMLDWLNNMGDWNISRKRFYGLPLPFYECEKCKKLVVLGSKEELKKLAVDPKKVDKLPHLHRPYVDEVEIICPHCGAKVKRVSEVGDTWLDAGITPFSTKKYFSDKTFWKKNYPSDCLIEGREQIRLWFYSLLVMGVTLIGKAPFKKLFCHAMLLDKNGNKLSKSSPNNIPYDEAVKKMGADVIRYNFESSNTLSDVVFSFEVADEVTRKLLSLWNIYTFVSTYAMLDNPKLDGFKPKVATLDITDRWLIQKTNEFVKLSDEEYKHQRFYNVANMFEELLDNISNWYIRVNRRRFWKSKDGEDKNNAYFSICYAIKNICTVMSPMIPFISEYIWQNLIRDVFTDSAESVFLGGFGEKLFEVNDKDIVSWTATVRDIITIAQRLRNENQIKIKQPLKTMFLNIKPEAMTAVKQFENIIKDELNLKEIVFEKDNTKFNDEFLTVNFKTAGQVLKGDVQKVKNILAEVSPDEMKKFVSMFNKGKVSISGFKDLTSDLFVFNYKAKSEYVIATENEKTVVLDVTIDNDLLLEGMFRELVRQAQVLRKEANFRIEQRVEMDITTDSETIMAVVNKYEDKIKQEVLVQKFGKKIDKPDISRELEVGGEVATIDLKAL